MRDGIKLRSNVTIVAGERGKEPRVVRVHNLVTIVGRNLLRDLISGDSSSPITHMGIGSGETPPDAADTTLESPVDRNAITLPHSDAEGSVTFTVYWGAGDGTGTISEAGLFTAPAAGMMYARVTFTPVVKSALMYLRIIWECVFEDDEILLLLE